VTINIQQVYEALGPPDLPEDDLIQCADPRDVGGDLTSVAPPLPGPSANTLEQARKLNVRMGIDPFHVHQSPAGRSIKFPFPVPRQGQLHEIDRILNELDAGRDVLFEAPTGVGKSPIALAVATAHESSWILVGRNDLIDQWEKDFEHLAGVGFYKSRNRVQCNVIKPQNPTDEALTCSEGEKLCSDRRTALFKRWKAYKEGGEVGVAPESTLPCPYAVNREMALAHDHTAMTLSLGLTIFTHLAAFHPRVNKRDVLIVDECSELEAELMKHCEYSMTTKRLLEAIPAAWPIGNLLPSGHDFYARWPAVKSDMRMDTVLDVLRPAPSKRDVVLWTIEVGLFAKTRGEQVAREIERIKPKTDPSMPADRREAAERMADMEVREQTKILKKCKDFLAMTHNLATGLKDVPYHVDVEVKPEHGRYRVKAYPLEARGLFRRICAPFADRIVFVSATTGSAEVFTAIHKLDPPPIKISAPSTFPRANRPILVLPVGNLSRRTIDTGMPLVLNAITAIVTSKRPGAMIDHANQKGVIHTFNNQITDTVIEHLVRMGLKDRVIKLQGGGRDRERAMMHFKAMPGPTILVSPSATMGLSLNGDLARWQIVAKVPYGPIGEPAVAHRKDNIPGWYNWQTAKDMIQAFGRIVRSDDDWGTTYIVDEAFVNFFSRNRSLFPEYILDAIQTVDVAVGLRVLRGGKP
jgi:ATP-dependent DNA helicase DinG